MEILWNTTVSAWFRATRPKLCDNCIFPQNFHTKKSSKITVFFAVSVEIQSLTLARITRFGWKQVCNTSKNWYKIWKPEKKKKKKKKASFKSLGSSTELFGKTLYLHYPPQTSLSIIFKIQLSQRYSKLYVKAIPTERYQNKLKWLNAGFYL